MAATADSVRDAYGTDRGVRFAVALGLSVACHLAFLVALRGFRMESQSMPPLVVTMLARGGGDEDGARPAPGPPAAAAVEVVSPALPLPAPPRVVPPVKAKPATRTHVPPRRTAPAVPAPAPVEAAAVERAVPVAGSGVVGAVGEAVGGADAGPGEEVASAGAGGKGAGSGGIAGNGADGLRVFCASCPAPEYPGRARRQGWQGTVDVELAIASDGSVREARVSRSSGYPALDDVAVDVARRSRFAVPNGGRELRGQLRYRFVLDATAARR